MLITPAKPTAPGLLQILTKLTFLEVALFISLVLHGFVLSMHFTFPPQRNLHDSGLAVVLVNRNTSTKKPNDPKDIQALAQVDLDGGGNTDLERRLSSPLPPTAYQQPGEFDTRRLQQKKVEELEAEQKALLATSQGTQHRLRVTEKPERKDSPKTKPDSGLDLVESAKALAREMAAIDRQIEEYNKRPRKTSVGLRTKNITAARYIEDWRIKVERIGTLNFPAGGTYGSLIITITLDRHGAITELEIDKSSGHPVLDEAAKRILHMAAPYPPFPPELLREMDLLSITRTMSFTNQGSTSISQD